MQAVIKCVAPAVLAAMMLAGCGQPNTQTASIPPAEPPAPVATTPVEAAPTKPAPVKAAAAKAVKVGDMAVCAICTVKEGTTVPEHVKAVINYKGKTYGFCNLEEKAEFISSPAKYAK